MSKILISYTSMTGHNEKIAEHLNQYLTDKGEDVTLEQLVDSDAYSLPDYDAVIIATYTYHDGEVPDEAQDFYEDLQDVDLDRTKFAVVGSSSKGHVHFGRAVDYFTMQLNSSNGEQVADSVKINQEPDEDDFKRVDQLADYVIKSLNK
ncbi:flavodoxin domain-containing protein [Companilactobacillus sp.]|uniref:flavodoxin domain-containing protein n=1 Tax=Companilactobacillus sp. TaxID=2767905 RepID=UPI0025C20A72|nr:flavodoxin domain-containing protein [Companilactobacillus sp.]MCH4009583.1 flavodoxin domain-containing protein [Companilactobacillus sp.]MCH4052741.1 flavodoxin domain-containing protein [Companilactobacillus sp.]MCH4077525.1 flavodoxin domain-containing protein [Companilactobacillus sp.]MCH4126101.1 flavodoxin domain-containing protein [Companilactobacillus sp.]MCI1311809.1 flavodoxin domain-containing protein [Companilactobacillus sp.]